MLQFPVANENHVKSLDAPDRDGVKTGLSRMVKNSSDLSLSIKRKCFYTDKFKEGTDRSYYNDSKSGLHEILF